MRETNLSIEYIDVNKLKPYEKNCKIHTDKQIRHIAASIEQFGFNDPLGIWSDDNIILEGNGRLEAMRLLGMKMAPCIRLEHMSDNERKAYIISHNHLNLQTGFDEKELLLQLEELQNNMNLESLGIEAEEYISKLTKLEKKELKPYRQVHYLISLDVNKHDKVVEIIEKLKDMEGVEVDSTMR